ncbi:unnamed protein product [Calypogeia fissa]
MSVFSITALDRLIESDRRSSSSSSSATVAAAAEGLQHENGSTAVLVKAKQNNNNSSNINNNNNGNNNNSTSAFQRERRPLYVSYPYSSTTTTSSSSAASSPPPRPRSPSPTSFSPSPYIVNHKRRVPNGGVDTKRTSQQNGFHVSEKSSVSRPSKSHEEQQLYVSSSRSSTEQQEDISSKDWPSNGIVEGSNDNKGESQDGRVVGKEHNSRSPQSSLTLQFQEKKKSVRNGDSVVGNSWYAGFASRIPDSDEIYAEGSSMGEVAAAAATEDKAKGGKRAGSVERRDISSRINDPRGKKKLEETPAAAAGLAEGSSRSRVRNAGSSSSSISGVSVDGADARTTSNSGSEEWFDASEGLPDYSSDDDSRRNPSDPGPSSRGDPDSNIILQLKAEIQRRIAAEEARECLQHQRDGMAQMLSSAGISVPQSEFGAVKLNSDKVLGISDSESQRLMVARYVAGAVATGAVKAEAEAELQTVLAEKSKEIARLKDKLQYYEVVNHEMSQRNQESIESARQSRRRRQRIQRFVVFGLSAAICVGFSVAAVYHYAPWEHVKNLSKGPVLLEGEQANPVPLEQVVDVQDLNPQN